MLFFSQTIILRILAETDRPVFMGSFSPGSIFPAGSYVPQILCSPGAMPPQVLYSPGPMFPGFYTPHILYSRVLCSLGYVPRVLCFPRSMFSVPRVLCSPR
jgi:hypothetical protein